MANNSEAATADTWHCFSHPLHLVLVVLLKSRVHLDLAQPPPRPDGGGHHLVLRDVSVAVDIQGLEVIGSCHAFSFIHSFFYFEIYLCSM